MASDKLFNQIKQGDRSAFEKVFREHFEGLRRYVWGYVNSEAVAEEIVQEVFLTIWKKRQELKIRSSLKAYLFKAARNKSIDWLRHQEVEQAWKQEQQAVRRQIKRPDQGERLHNHQMLTAVEEAIQALPDRRKQVFILSRYENMSYKEIATQLEISVSTVETHISLALQTLGKKFLPLLSVALLMMVI